MHHTHLQGEGSLKAQKVFARRARVCMKMSHGPHGNALIYTTLFQSVTFLALPLYGIHASKALYFPKLSASGSDRCGRSR